MAKLQIIDDKKKNYRKKSVISACNVDYRLKRSGPIDRLMIIKGRWSEPEPLRLWSKQVKFSSRHAVSSLRIKK